MSVPLLRLDLVCPSGLTLQTWSSLLTWCLYSCKLSQRTWPLTFWWFSSCPRWSRFGIVVNFIHYGISWGRSEVRSPWWRLCTGGASSQDSHTFPCFPNFPNSTAARQAQNRKDIWLAKFLQVIKYHLALIYYVFSVYKIFLTLYKLCKSLMSKHVLKTKLHTAKGTQLVWCCMSAIPAVLKRKEDCQVETILVCMLGLCFKI